MKNSIAVGFLMLLTGCFSAPLQKLVSDEGQSIFESGRELLTKENDTVAVTVSYDQTDGANFVVHLRVKNKSAETFIVDPTTVFYTVVSPREWITRHAENDTVFALDPEKIIANFEMQMQQERNARSTENLLRVFSSSLSLVSDIASIGEKKTDEELEKKEKERNDQRQQEMQEDIRHEVRMKNLSDAKEYWQNNVLRKTSLLPSASVSGKIYLPYFHGVKELLLVVRTGNVWQTFSYHQEKL